MGSTMRVAIKSYDRAYFDRWYRDPIDRVATTDSLRRKVRMAVSIAEFLLGRRIRTVLDIGCGEAPWFPVLRSLRKDVRYIGIESSEYALEQYGRARNIRRGSLAELGSMRLPRLIDLVVCADVLQYVEATRSRTRTRDNRANGPRNRIHRDVHDRRCDGGRSRPLARSHRR